jgi:hypothetical protein
MFKKITIYASYPLAVIGAPLFFFSLIAAVHSFFTCGEKIPCNPCEQQNLAAGSVLGFGFMVAPYVIRRLYALQESKGENTIFVYAPFLGLFGLFYGIIALNDLLRCN